jgi:hypothetical protein
MTTLTKWLINLLGLRRRKPAKPAMSMECQAAFKGDFRIASVRTKAGERYVFTWLAGQEPELFRSIGRYAASPEHPGFDWLDAAMVAGTVEGK